jgi:4-hydroxybenzoate polyprenyltransferase
MEQISLQKQKNLGFSHESQAPICVDLSGVLIKTNLLTEAVIKYCKQNPFNIFKVIYWSIFRNSNFFKKKITEKISLNSSLLPYNQSVVSYLQEAKQNRRPIFLMTDSPALYAAQIAEYLGCFDHILTHLSAPSPFRSSLENGDFTHIKRRAHKILPPILAKEVLWVDTSFSFRKKGTLQADHVIDQSSTPFTILLKQFRIHQWVKNILVFVPLLAAHSISHLGQTCLAFVSFCLLASAIYVINDLCDLEADRQHPTKKLRPFASGQIPLEYGFYFVFFLTSLSFYTANLINAEFLKITIIYFAINLSYNLTLKKKPIVDVICLASLYLLRILGGHVATMLPFSFWLTTFALFFFLSLALIKRYTEVAGKHQTSGRGYILSDAPFIGTLGLTASAIAILVFILYLNSPEVKNLYKSLRYLWLSIPLLFYWMSRLWLKAFRKEMDDDPIAFALKDKESYMIAALLLLSLCFAAIL